MTNETGYAKQVGDEHIKSYGQYFTPNCIAEFMVGWACEGASTMLDPAVGNSIFFKYTQKHNPKCKMFGYEKDKKIINFFGNPCNATVFEKDYFDGDWDIQYDAIVCNPPYSKFQAISNRDQIIKNIFIHTGMKCSGYTNLYLLFLYKSIFQLSENGRLAYIIPNEFLNSQYGTNMKEMLLEQKLIRAIINFQNNDIFENAITTSCILLLDRKPKTHVDFMSLKNIDEITKINQGNRFDNLLQVSYADLKANEKWREYLNFEKPFKIDDNLTVDLSTFCHVSRGIATGANDYFCFSIDSSNRFDIPHQYLKRCISRSADVTTPIFTDADFLELEKQNKNVYLLDIVDDRDDRIKSYIEYGIQKDIAKKYLPSCRTPWYSIERKKEAPIWISTAYREKIKVVRNLANVSNLTTFHSVYVNDLYKEYTDIIFCYLLTPVAQSILQSNRKELGNGLKKFQPNDFNCAKMFDLTRLKEFDKVSILNVFEDMKICFDDSQVQKLNEIFISYM